MEPLGIKGAGLFTPNVHRDQRGSFHEWLRADELADFTGHRLELAQANCSTSVQGVLRGLHFADVPPGQAKYISCIRGAVFDVVVDIRVGSPTFGQWAGARLDDENRRCVYVAEGLGHGFLTLSESATVNYLCSTSYNPGHEHEIDPLDPAIGIEWPAEIDRTLLSAKDLAAPSLAEALERGLLPDYQQCLDYYEKLRTG